MDLLPYEYADLASPAVTTAGRGVVRDGFGAVRVRAMEGRAVAIEITDELSGRTMAAVLDWGRPKAARVNLQADLLCEAIRAASDEDGLPVLFPVPR